MIAAGDLRTHLEQAAAPPSPARAVATLARVEGRRLVTHPAIIVALALALVQSLPFIFSSDSTAEHNVGWLVQVSALFVSFAALLAVNLLASQSRRDGSEELFLATPMSLARRTIAWALAGAWAMGTVALLVLIGDLAIRAAGKGAATDTGRVLFPMFDLVQGPLLAGLFVLIGIAVARKLPKTVAGPLALVVLFVAGNYVLNAEGNPTWLRLTPFGPTFLDDGGALQALHVLYLVALGGVFLALALYRPGRSAKAGAWLAGGLSIATVSGALQLIL